MKKTSYIIIVLLGLLLAASFAFPLIFRKNVVVDERPDYVFLESIHKMTETVINTDFTNPDAKAIADSLDMQPYLKFDFSESSSLSIAVGDKYGFTGHVMPAIKILEDPALKMNEVILIGDESITKYLKISDNKNSDIDHSITTELDIDKIKKENPVKDGWLHIYTPETTFLTVKVPHGVSVYVKSNFPLEFENFRSANVEIKESEYRFQCTNCDFTSLIFRD